MKCHFTLLILTMSTLLSAQSVTMMLSPSSSSGNEITYDVSVMDFNGMGSMQYSILYDPAKMEFLALQNLNLDDLTTGSFNTNPPGIIRNVWFDMDAIGETVPDNTVIYQLVFKILGSSPGTICFANDPLMIEFSKYVGGIQTFIIQDDCHPEPFEIQLTTSSTSDLSKPPGMKIQSVSRAGLLTFSLDKPSALSIRIFDMKGEQVFSCGKMQYIAGSNSLNLGSSLVPGMYLLHAEEGEEAVTIQFAFQ